MAKARQATLEADVAEETATEPGAGESSEPRRSGSAAGGQPLIDLDFVRGLIAALDASGIDSLEITRAGARIKISKTPPSSPVYGAPALHMAAQPAAAAPPAAPDPGAAGGQGGSAAATEAASPASNLIDVKSPMVGTFYRSPAPEAPPYVEVGTRVGKGQTLCILEAMKLMNELEAEVEGVVREVLVDNAEPVEYGQVLFRIDPAG